jgi:chromosome segregation ATPase
MTATDADAGPSDIDEEPRGLRERLSSQAEDRIGKLADELLENPIINSALQRAFSAREKMAQAQETAMEALNLPSASSLDRVARKLRSMSQRLDDLEDGMERLDQRLDTAAGKPAKLNARLDRIESRLDELGRDIAAIRRDIASGEAVPASQTQAVVPEG